MTASKRHDYFKYSICTEAVRRLSQQPGLSVANLADAAGVKIECQHRASERAVARMAIRAFLILIC
jgi:hypothetical protein